MKEKNNYFKDEGMQGMYEFNTPVGRFRFEDKGCNIFLVFEENGNAFIHCGRIRIKGKATPKKLYDKYLENIDFEESE